MKVPKKKLPFYQQMEEKAYKALIPQHLTEAQEDLVNSPKHYVQGGMEVIEVLEKKMTPEAFKGFLMGNVLKYVLRHEYKGKTEDLKKSRFYLDRMIKLGEEYDENPRKSP